MPWSIRELNCIVTRLLSAMQYYGAEGKPRNDAIIQGQSV